VSALAARALAVCALAASQLPSLDTSHPPPQYLPNLLPADDADAVLQEALTMRPQLRQELNCIAVGRMGAYVPPESVTTGVFSTKELSRKLQQVSGGARTGCVLASRRPGGVWLTAGQLSP
jgi:hypothetical protein